MKRPLTPYIALVALVLLPCKVLGAGVIRWDLRAATPGLGGADHPQLECRGTDPQGVVGVPLDLLGVAMDKIRMAPQHLVVQLHSPRVAEWNTQPCACEVVEPDATLFGGRPQVCGSSRVVLDAGSFRATTRDGTLHGGDQEPTFAVAGRNRIEVRGGKASAPWSGVLYTRYVREDVAVTFALDAFSGVYTGTSSVLALPMGVRWNPVKGDPSRRAVKPYLAAGVGPVRGAFTAYTLPFGGPVFTGGHAWTFEGQLSIGVDVHVARSWSIGFGGGYNWMGDFPQAMSARRNYSGFELSCGVGWLFGRGHGLR